MLERTLYLAPASTGEDRSFYTLLAFSLLGHILFFVIDKAELTREREPLFEEWAVEADLLPDVHVTSPKENALPDAQKTDELAVRDNLLPQLPKKFAIDKAAEEEAINENEEQKIEKPKDETNTDQNVNKTQIQIKSDKDEMNRLAMQDALKRLAMEKLRKEMKVAKTNKADNVDAMAKIKDEMGEDALNKALESSLNLSAEKNYRAKLRSHVGRFWSVPEAYNIKNAELRVRIAISVNAMGNLVSHEIKQSSGDVVFDDLAFNAIKNAEPLPNPPEELMGVEILLDFTPKSY